MRAGSRRGGRPALIDLVWASACAAAVVAVLLAAGGIWEHVGGGDLHGIFLPKYEYVARAVVREHRLPLWNPHEFCGLPLLGVGQGGTLYPLAWGPFAFLAARPALQAVYALHVFLLAWATLAYLRRHAIGRPAALVAVLVVLAGLFRGPALVGVDHPSFIASIAWIPVLLLATERAVRRDAARGVALLGLAAAAQWLVGYPDFPIDMAVLLVLVALATAGARGAALVVAGLALGALLAGVQILPLAEAVGESPRAARIPYAAIRAAMPASAALGALTGRDGVARYGIAALALAAIALVRPSRARGAWLAALLWSVFALTFPLTLLYVVPPYSRVRLPFGWSGCAALFLGYLAAAGLQTLWTRPRAAWRALAVVLGLAVAAHAFTVVRAAPRAPELRAPDRVLIDSRVPALRRILATLGDGSRLLSLPEMEAGVPLLEGLSSPGGYEPSLPPRRIVELLRALDLYVPGGLGPSTDWAGVARRPALAALLGVGLVVVPPARAKALLDGGFTPLEILPGGDVAHHRPPLARTRLVHRVVPAADDGASFARVRERGDEAATSVVVQGTADLGLAEPEPGASEEARIALDAPEEVAVDVVAAARGVLVLADTHYPGWQATVDGVGTPILRTDHAFRGVVVDSGRHRVVFRYAPASLGLGAAASGIALAAIAVLFWRGRPEKRR